MASGLMVTARNDAFGCPQIAFHLVDPLPKKSMLLFFN